MAWSFCGPPPWLFSDGTIHCKTASGRYRTYVFGRSVRLELVILIFIGLGMGLASTVPFGPINTEVARRTLKQGFLPGLAFGMGAVLFELMIVIAAATGFGIRLDGYPRVEQAMLAIGCVVLFVMGVIALRAAKKAWSTSTTSPDDSQPSQSIDEFAELRASPALLRAQMLAVPRSAATGAMMTMLSLPAWLFWLLAVPAVAQRHAMDGFFPVTMFLAGAAAGLVGWIAVLASVTCYLKRFAQKWWIIVADLIGAGMLLCVSAIAGAAFLKSLGI
jgi:threonine/homoserine/homoserine lactone efflux protein